MIIDSKLRPQIEILIEIIEEASPQCYKAALNVTLKFLYHLITEMDCSISMENARRLALSELRLERDKYRLENK